MKQIILILTVPFLLLSCNQTKTVVGTTENIEPSGSFRVATLNGESIEVEMQLPYITFNTLDNSIKGKTGCNAYFGKYSREASNLSFLDIASTEMACVQPIMDVENAFLQALRYTGSYQIKDNVLTLFSRDDQSVLLTATKESYLIE